MKVELTYGELDVIVEALSNCTNTRYTVTHKKMSDYRDETAKKISELQRQIQELKG